MSNIKYEYQYGGSLPIDAPSYIIRKADSEFYQYLKAGEFCYVLNSRQMGKSSLRVRTMNKLQAEGILCAFVDLTGIGKEDVNPEKWYAGIVQSLVSSCQLTKKVQWRSWWRERRDLLSPVQRLSLFIEEVLLEIIEQNIVIFIDEIDLVRSHDFSLDDFFALIRYFYNQRVFEPKYKRLTFALLGVATPSDLITDKTQTPFNIGKAIELHGFEFQEAKPLALGLEEKVNNPQEALKEILNWSGGQPFLSQKLCQLVVQNLADGMTNYRSIQQLVQTRIINNWEAQDEPPHLRTIRDRLLKNKRCIGQILGIYQQILQQGEIVANGSVEQTELRLSGLVVQEQGKLRIYNKIYQHIFSHKWLERQLEQLRPYAENLNAWVASNYQDESQLLKGELLQKALSWSRNHSLSEVDYYFLGSSQELEKLKVKQILDIKEQESIILAEANKTLIQAQQKSKRIVSVGTVILIISLLAATVVGLQVKRANRELAEASISLESFSAKEVYNNISPFDALLSALKVGKQLQQLEKSAPVRLDRRTEVLNTLRFVVSGIREQNRLQGHLDRVTRVNFSPNGKIIASGSEDKTIKLWNIQGKLLKTLKDHRDHISGVSFSPDSKTLASASRDGTIKLWNVDNGTLLKTILAHNNTWVRSVSFSPDGELLVSCGSRGWVKFWNVKDGTLVRKIPAHRTPNGRYYAVTHVSFSPDGTIVASTSFDNKIKLWKVEDGSLLKTLKGHRDEVRVVTFSPDGKTLASSSADKTIKLWDVENGIEIKTPTPRGHRGTVWGVSFSPDGKTLVSSAEDGLVKLWNLEEKGIEPQIFRGHVGIIRSVTFSPDGKMIVSTGSDHTVRLWNVEGLEGTEPRTFTNNQGDVSVVSFSPNGKILASADTDNTIKLWNVADGTLLIVLKGHSGDVFHVSFSPDGKFLASASLDNTVRLWNVKNGTLVQTFKGHSRSVYAVSFSPDGKILASAGDDRTVKLWRLTDQVFLQSLKGHLRSVRSVSFSPDGEVLASAGFDHRVILWSVEDGRMLKVLDRGNLNLVAVSFSPDGKLLASSGGDAAVKLWNVADGTEVRTLEGHGSWVRDIDFSPDGKIVASAGFDRKVILWNVADGTEVQTLEGHLGRVFSISFSPDGKLLASASEDGTVKLWNLTLDIEDFMELGCQCLRDYIVTQNQDEEIQNICRDY
ncbi:MAG: hypothetical protein F6K18_21380 [Okeania sp. SIO2C2]|uniref:WD40 domain-containing protein n=1 Tax=Okeania sp. SIO2C2 TaxID=2607787 RepID=UPI0013BBCFE0|nr:AAA-like domain-containing protein [Okeania sp. SIO2C2]NEP89175.1 hypothetical protein [Okeania sp. SIO2C2]